LINLRDAFIPLGVPLPTKHDFKAMRESPGGMLRYHSGVALAHAPVNDHMLMNTFWLGHVDGAGAHLLELINRPSLNINGFSSGQTGARAANVIPPTATADLDLRLVVGIDWREQQQRVIDYIRSRGYFIVDREARYTQQNFGHQDLRG
jgi:acetylornithine deacetylase/succinyl-diaminopimelate desuccinylase-like protein